MLATACGSNLTKSIVLVLLMLVFLVAPTVPSRSEEAGGGLTNPENVRKYFAQGLLLPLLKARTEKRSFIPLLERSRVSTIEILGDRDPRYDGVVISYFHNISHVARTKFEFASGGDFIIVIQDGLKNWRDLAEIARKSTNFSHISTVFESAARRSEKFNSCEYVPLSSSRAIEGGLVYVDTSFGFFASEVCLYRAAFSMFGFFVGANTASGVRDMVLDLTAIRLLYQMDESERALDSALDNLFSAYVSQHSTRQ